MHSAQCTPITLSSIYHVYYVHHVHQVHQVHNVHHAYHIHYVRHVQLSTKSCTLVESDVAGKKSETIDLRPTLSRTYMTYCQEMLSRQEKLLQAILSCKVTAETSVDSTGLHKVSSAHLSLNSERSLFKKNVISVLFRNKNMF